MAENIKIQHKIQEQNANYRLLDREGKKQRLFCGVGRSAGSTQFPHPSPLPFYPSLPFPFPNHTAGNVEIHPDLL